MNDDQLLRYSRHVLLDGIGIEGQERLLAARALVVGLGGLGSPVALFLASAGVGHVTLVDGDAVDLTNLQRQLAHTVERIGQPKVHSAAVAMAAINPETRVSALNERADAERLEALVGGVDVVIDCSDNFATRHALNRAAVRCAVPLVSGSAMGFDGQVAVFDRRSAGSACYACLFRPDMQITEQACATMGVLAPLVGIVGSMQAAEAIKLLAGRPSALADTLLMLDARTMEWTRIRAPRQPDCPVCATRPGH